MNKQINYIRKSQQMELTKNQIQLSLTKTELNQVIAEALADAETSAALPEFINIVLGDTDESGATQVILKQPTTPKATGPIKSIEPTVIDEPVVQEEESTPVNEYVEAAAD